MGVDHDYNQFAGFSQIPYKIMEYLMTTNENIWKLLKYPSHDALKQTNLTSTQKRTLIYRPDVQSDAYRLFTVRFVEDAVLPEVTRLHIYIGKTNPFNAQVGTVDIIFDVFCHNKIAVLSYPGYRPNRYDVIFEELMKTLNGKDVDTLGRLYFNRGGLSHNSGASGVLSFSKDNIYQGRQIIMSVNV